MINQTAKKILKALSFDGVEVEAFRHMADLKRLDPMKIFYKKIDEKIYYCYAWTYGLRNQYNVEYVDWCAGKPYNY